MTLEPIEPTTAIELYFAEKETELRHATILSHKSRLGHFVRWCDKRDITNLNTLTGRQLHEYRLWRRNDGDLSKVSVKTQLDTLRVFIRWCETIDAVEPDLHTKILSPNVTPDENTRDVKLDADHAEQILEYLDTYHYASLQHVTLALLWQTMLRCGAAHALDIDDYDPDDQYLEVKNRPTTPIKNGPQGERLIALSGDLCNLLDDYLRDQHPNTTDDHDRNPLLATQQGRIAKTTIRRYTYKYTRPCAINNDCPHDRTPDTCEATTHNTFANCPSSVSPHPIRRGSITHHLMSDIPETAVSDKANVSQPVLAQHYDRRTKHEKMEQRRKCLNNL